MTIHTTAGICFLVGALALAPVACGDSRSTPSPTQPTPPGDATTSAHITIEGLVLDGGSSSPAFVQGAFVRLIVDGQEGPEVTTDANGRVSFDIPFPQGSTAIDVRAPGFAAVHFPFDVGHDRDVRLTISLTRDGS